MLIEVNKSSRKLYEQEFECVLLQETEEYYKQESNQLITEFPCFAYLEKAHMRLMQEFERNSSYLSPSTENKLIQTFLDVYLSDWHSTTLLEMQSSGLIHMINNNKISEISVLYNMFQRRVDSFELLKKALSQYIMEEGNKLV